ncbi:hypothetical protein IV203_035558 [Nitzschia inconspicua]|uniref:Uncharacterized protein n=1 Tax=Nitzschia inconspicua TaxID=303405 RepID=A0A9K3LEX8_9STRA|nr:hypothetical protein IV203_010183 [Nitzschia inconspicua]KAG7360459.1 hypothetical protein IV203_035558 [Nitzschia inconspicua]
MVNICHKNGQLRLFLLVIGCFAFATSKLAMSANTKPYSGSPTSAILVASMMFASSIDVVFGEPPRIESHEDLIASRQKRRQQLENVVQNAKQKLEDDRTGKHKLSDQARSQFEHKIRAYEVQIAELGRDLGEEEMNQILKNRHRSDRDEL